MNKARLEAFSDGVIAIIITIMVLEIKVPEGVALATLKPLIPKFISYVLSFTYVGIYWNNHHHLLHAVKKINGKILWANLFFLFWLSLFPVAAGWMGENHFALWPVIVYGIVLFLAAIGYTILVMVIKSNGENSLIVEAIGNDSKGKLSLLFYIAGIGLSFISPWLGMFMYFIVACIWFIPDKRIEHLFEQENSTKIN
ncbi:TMEM175 family protein [Pedobacter punctiformis]|uniref:TMEM175 family protein n=1 Tax=Pedobacter punctiformis TaxID=3004097 RepID=A0ABT4LDA5_9SPHI|nr:TMEM175 family protein [Pedobacter sp. HCMS5-2]MCZ4245907.1 TMEM175 family protein [Pedobacter sp. HCMS5-2]